MFLIKKSLALALVRPSTATASSATANRLSCSLRRGEVRLGALGLHGRRGARAIDLDWRLRGRASLADRHLAGDGLELEDEEARGCTVERLARLLVLAVELLGVVEGGSDLGTGPVDGVEARGELLGEQLHDERHVRDKLDGGHGVGFSPVLLGETLGRELVQRLAHVHEERSVLPKVGQVVLRVPTVRRSVDIEKLPRHVLGEGLLDSLLERGDRDRGKVGDGGHLML